MHSTTAMLALALVLALPDGRGAQAEEPAAAPPAAPGDSSEGTGTETASDTDTEAADGGSPAADQPARREPSRSGTLMQLDEVIVEADRPLSAASSAVIRTRDYALRPHSTTQEILNNVPGLVVVQHAGGGKAVQYFLRGFDIDHGTDFALFTDGIPVNMVTHAHGQGYADINYLIPETVKTLQLYKGPYFVHLGDFATAGALEITTKDEYEENFALAEGGSFDTQRYVLGGSIPIDWAKTLLTAEAYFTNGPFDNPENYARYNFFGKFTINPAVDHKLSLLASVYSGDWDGSGQIPVRIVGDEPGDINRFASLDPTEGGNSDRENLSAIWSYKPTAEEEWEAQVWGAHYHLRLYSNFTFFRDTGLRFYTDSPGSGRYIDRCAGQGAECADAPPAGIPLNQFIPGDGIEQYDERLLWGGFASYKRFWNLDNMPGLGDVPMATTFGVQTRGDSIDVALWRQVRRNRFYQFNAVSVYQQSLSGYWGQQIFFTDWARLEGGVRGDVFVFDTNDRLAVQPDDPNFVAVPIQGNEVQGLASPKANLILGPWQNTEVYANFGYGFHSNDARAVALTGTDGLVQALGYELGSRTRQFDRLDLAAALWLIDLDSELTFSGDGGDVDADQPVPGVFIPGPPSRRWGVDFEARYQFTDWLFADFDLTWADPRFKYGTTGLNQEGQEVSGNAIPLAPTLLMNGGLTAEFGNGFAGALRFRNLGERPANEIRTFYAQGYTLLDLILRYRWRNVEASLALLNLTDTDWRQSQFVESTCVNQITGLDFGAGSSDCQPQGNRPYAQPDPYTNPGIEGITFTPGAPFAVRGGLQIFF
ncbi:MAG: TonB-dependent receptor [Candidatus Binatia bacterium]